MFQIMINKYLKCSLVVYLHIMFVVKLKNLFKNVLL